MLHSNFVQALSQEFIAVSQFLRAGNWFPAGLVVIADVERSIHGRLVDTIVHSNRQ